MSIGRARKRSWLVISAAFLAVGVAWASPGLADFNININIGPPPPVVVVREEVDLGYNLIFGVVAAELLISREEIVVFYRNYRLPPEDVVLIFYLAKASGRPPIYIHQLRGKGHGWGVIAKQLGLHPSAARWLNKANAHDIYITRVIATRYGLPPERVLVLREKGYKINEIALAVNVAHQSNRDVAEVFEMRGKGLKWKEIGERHKIDERRVAEPSEVVRGKGRVEKEKDEEKEKDQKPEPAGKPKGKGRGR